MNNVRNENYSFYFFETKVEPEQLAQKLERSIVYVKEKVVIFQKELVRLLR